MNRFLAAAVLLLAAACSKPAPFPGSASAEYSAPDGSFTARLPGGWKVDDSPGRYRKAAFFGPPDGAKPFSELIAVSFYPAGGRYRGPDDYIAGQAALGKAGPSKPVTVGDALGVEVTVATTFPDPHAGPRPLITRALAVPAAGGFFALEDTRPEDLPASKEFDELLGSFKPGPAPR
jgi:hypothetical protein